ncbi:MAG: hypothetical protein U5K69_18870 [Balneolaceae bacterium]|nr:hypothetical protein [Balneolaceae bacterium]
MRKLTELQLSGSFSGTIPDSWQNMKMLWRVDFTDIDMDGDFPEWLGNGDFHNRVTVNDPDPDAIPVEAHHSGLGTFSAGFNNFTGNFPDFSKMTWLNSFRVPFSNIGGTFPEDASGLRRLIQFDISSNGVSGQLPDLSSWNRPRFINVPYNKLSGPLPDLDTSNGDFRNSQWQGNSFSGAIPAGWNYPGSNNIFRLWLHDNNLSGPIPERLADSGHSYSSGFRVDGNRYVFADLVPFIKLGPNNFQYAPQQAFGSAATRYLSEGESVSIDDFSGVVGHSGNRYQWQKDGKNISGATSRKLSVSSVSPADQGTYRLVVTNPAARL